MHSRNDRIEVRPDRVIPEPPRGVDRRGFVMTGAMSDAVSVVSGPQQKIRDGMLAAVVVGGLSKHNATPAAVNAMALIAKETRSQYKETAEGGLAVSVVLC